MSTYFESEEVRPPVSSETADNAPVVSTEAEETGAQRSVVGSMLLPFKVRNFSLFFGGQIISTAGDALYAVALPWLILNNGGNAQDLSIVLTAYSISRVGSVLLGGWLSDRLRPRRIMLIADIIRSVLVALLAALALGGHPGLLVLCAIAVPLGAFGGLFLPASSAILPDILNDENLQAGNALNFSSMQAATLVGAALAGVIVAALSSSAALAIDALTFVVSAISLAMMRTVRLTASSKPGTTAHTQTGLATDAEEDEHPEELLSFGRFLRTSRLIQVAFLISIAANFCVGGLMEVALPTLAHGPMHAGAGGYGAILAGFGAGALVGGICAGMLSDIPKKGLSALLICLVQGLTIVFLPYGGVFGAIALMLIAGICNSITNVLLTTLIQLVIPRHLMGRVMGLLMFASFGSYPISLALAGVLTNAFGPAILFPFGGATLILAIFLGIAQKELREL
ncbi:MAG TPA: MFS transporter [Ktedonobacteraceae bacterium]|nr:MFS transporter [Ktedonobacteraceae bacterium]